MKLRVLSYNIHKGFSVANFRFNLHLIKSAIEETNADVCFLQEVVGHHRSVGGRAATGVKKELPTEAQFEYLADRLWSHFSYGKNAVFPNRHHGNAILSKFPIISSHNVDISTNRLERRGLLHCVIEIQNLKIHLDLFNTHLNLLHRSRLIQTDRIIRFMHQRLPTNRALIFAGDFNDWNGGLTEKLAVDLHLTECFHTIHGRHAKTYPSFLPLVSLDRVFFRHLKLIHQSVLDFGHWRRLSDHLPLFVEFDLPPTL